MHDHWEGDLLSGSKNSHIATMVERHTRFVMFADVANKETQAVVSALIQQARKLPCESYKSLTSDLGKELADYRRFSLATGLPCTSMIYKALGSAVPTRTPMFCCGRTSQGDRLRSIPKRI